MPDVTLPVREDRSNPPAPSKRKFRGISRDYPFQRDILIEDGEGGIKTLSLKDSLKVINHSPTGFNWGYGGSGPAQAAFAILNESVGETVALRYYQRFKETFLTSIPDQTTDWYIKESLIELWLKAIRYDSKFDISLIEKGDMGVQVCEPK